MRILRGSTLTVPSQRVLQDPKAEVVDLSKWERPFDKCDAAVVGLETLSRPGDCLGCNSFALDLVLSKAVLHK